MRYLSVIFFAAATLLLILVVACGGDGDGDSGGGGAVATDTEGTPPPGFPAVSEGNAIPEVAEVDLDNDGEPDWVYTQNFDLENCTFKPHGEDNSLYDPLTPGRYSVSVYSGKLGEIAKTPIEFRKEYLVLPETEKYNLRGIGPFEAAAVQEKEYENGQQIALSVNWFAICEETGGVYSIGEYSWTLNPSTGEVLNTEGSWRAGYVNILGETAVPAVAMPPEPTLGLRYIFDGAPGLALGGTEVVAVDLSIVNGRLSLTRTNLTSTLGGYGFPGETDVFIPALESAGEVKGCIQIEEISQDSGTRLPDLKDITEKVWCPGYGLVFDTSDGALVEARVMNDSELAEQTKQYAELVKTVQR